MRQLAIISGVIFIFTMAFIWGCSTTQLQPPAPPISSLPSSSPQYPVHGWLIPDYDNLVFKNVTPTMLQYGDGARWIKFIKAIAQAESSFNRVDFYLESGIKDSNGQATVDSVTHKPMVSQGLMQISYADQKNWPKAIACQRMDYSKDQGKTPDDPSLTINDPDINISCAMALMDLLLQKYPGDVRAAVGKYWSTVRSEKAIF